MHEEAKEEARRRRERRSERAGGGQQQGWKRERAREGGGGQAERNEKEGGQAGSHKKYTYKNLPITCLAASACPAASATVDVVVGKVFGDACWGFSSYLFVGGQSIKRPGLKRVASCRGQKCQCDGIRVERGQGPATNAGFELLK